MAKYTVAAGVVSAPTGSFYHGDEVTAETLGIDKDRWDHLIDQGAIAESKEGDEKAAAEKSPGGTGTGDGDTGGAAKTPPAPAPVTARPAETEVIESRTVTGKKVEG